MAQPAVILDFHGTLAYREGTALREMLHEAQARGYEVYRQEFEAAWNYVNLVDNPHMDLPGWPAFMGQVLRRLGVEMKSEDLGVLVNLAQREEFVLYGDVVPCLREIQGRRPAAIVTSIPRFRLERSLEELRGLVEVVITARDVGVAKPNPRIFRKALETLGADPSVSTAVGDEPEWDLEVPRSLGMRGVLVDRQGQGPHPEFPTISQLTELPALLEELDKP